MKVATTLSLLLGPFVCVNALSQTAVSSRPGDGGPALHAQICDPTAIAISRGYLFVAEGCFQTAAIRKIDLNTRVISTLTALPTAGIVADFAVDTDGNLVAADPVKNRILRINTSDGSVEVIAGTGDYGFSGDDGPATKAEFNQPNAVALDRAGDIFVADGGDSRIRRIDARTGIITTVAGSGKKGITGDGGQALNAGLEWPTSIAVDHDGNLYIGQNTNDATQDRIRRVDAKTGLISTYSTTEAPPNAMLFDVRGNLVIAEASRIKLIHAASGTVETIMGPAEGFPDGGGQPTKAHLEDPSALALDESGNLYMADYVSHRIRRIRAKDGVIENVAGNGEPHHAHVLM